MVTKLTAGFIAILISLGVITGVAGAVPIQGTDGGGWVLGALCTYHTNQDFNPDGTTHVNVDAYQRTDRPFRPECNRGNVVEATVFTNYMGFQFWNGDFYTCATGRSGANEVQRPTSWGSGPITGSPFGTSGAPAFRIITGYIEPGHVPYTYGTLPSESGHLKIRDAATSQPPGWNGVYNCHSLDMK